MTLSQEGNAGRSRPLEWATDHSATFTSAFQEQMKCGDRSIGCIVSVVAGKLTGLVGELIGRGPNREFYVRPLDMQPGVLLAINSNMLELAGSETGRVTPSRPDHFEPATFS
jgi:hypothetical protein